MSRLLPGPMLPVPSNLQALLKRLHHEERQWVRRLAELENRIRSFEDLERPAYEGWLRLEFGPQLLAVEELGHQIRERQIFAQRVMQLVESEGLHPREALFQVLNGYREDRDANASNSANTQPESESGNRQAFDPDPRRAREWSSDEVEARRRAKLDAKRAARRDAKKEAKQEKKKETEEKNGASSSGSSSPSRGPRSILLLYRALARKLHPDSATFVRSISQDRARALWLEVQAAYETASLEGLLAIAAWLENESERDGSLPQNATFLTTLTLSERFERLRSLSRSVLRTEKRIVQMEAHPAWGFEKSRGSERRKIRSAAAQRISEELARLQDAFESLENFIDEIGPPRPPKNRPPRRH